MDPFDNTVLPGFESVSSYEQRPLPPPVLAPRVIEPAVIEPPSLVAADVNTSPDAEPPDEVELPPHAGTFEVEVVKSARRKSTVGSTLTGSRLTLTVPAWMGQADIDKWVAEMSKRWASKIATDAVDLPKRAATLASRYKLPTPVSIGWSNMATQWGSCTPSKRTIRLSTRLAGFPDWVLDYVIVHELAHISVPDHSAGFWALVHRYPRTERARGYLIAKAGDDESE
jgi:predicted metal-dependent hydrolase